MPTRQPDRVTYQDIARELGVSVGLVSLAMSNKYGVSEETRSRIVLKAIDLGYDFSRCASKRVIDVVVCHKNLVSQSTYWSEIIQGLETRLNREKFAVNFLYTADGGNDIMEQLILTGARGVILVHPVAALLKNVHRIKVPVVLLDPCDNVAYGYDKIFADNFYGGYIMAQYLYEKGHRKILCVGNTLASYAFLQRVVGFKNFFDKAEDGEFQLIFEKERKTDAYDIFDEAFFLETVRKREVTAIMCVNDPIAILAYRLLKREGFSVPEDFSMIGFDNDADLKNNFPYLTTVYLNKTNMGKLAAEKILRRINGCSDEVEVTEMEVHILERSSVRPCG